MIIYFQLSITYTKGKIQLSILTVFYLTVFYFMIIYFQLSITYTKGKSKQNKQKLIKSNRWL